MRFNIAKECISIVSKELFSLDSSYKAKEYLSADVSENLLFLLNLFSQLCDN